jgi:apolipoprotein N-acyltransferase
MFARSLGTKPWLWLLLGTLATCAGHLRWGIDLLAWLAPIAWLQALRMTISLPSGRERRLGIAAFAGAWTLAWILTVAKLITTPVPAMAAIGFGVPIGLLLLWPYLVWAWLLHRRTSPTLLPLGFAAAMVIAEWSAYSATEFGTWGALANAALSDLPLLQLAALAGPTAIGFVVHALAAALEQRWAEGEHASRPLALSATLFVAAHGFGGIRLAVIDESPNEVVRVAAIGTDSDVGGLPLPSPERVERWNQSLFERTRVAARAGAELIVWTEAATMVLPEDEPAWLERLGELARSEGVPLVAGYVIPLGEQPLRYENLYVLIREDGQLEQRYRKHHPVPGEPAVPGDGPAPVWVSPTLGRVSGAICYDGDFPALGRAHARAKIDLLALPSSDWRGIDPIHTEMVRLRAIEGGYAILRSTRWGLSAGIDAAGRIRGRVSDFEDEQRISWVSLPRHGRRTLYGWAGEWFVFVCAGFVAAVLARALRA